MKEQSWFDKSKQIVTNKYARTHSSKNIGVDDISDMNLEIFLEILNSYITISI